MSKVIAKNKHEKWPAWYEIIEPILAARGE
jgi:hypothetical protein